MFVQMPDLPQGPESIIIVRTNLHVCSACGNVYVPPGRK